VFFDSWTDLIRVAAVGVPAYCALILLLRISGKRTLSKLNAFDLVVTVAMGSTLATILLSRDVSLAEGIAALGLLVALQFVITWTSTRSRSVRGLVRSEPTLLVYRGRLLDDALAAERVTRGEVLAAARAQGVAEIASLGAVVLETDGTISVIRLDASDQPSTLDGVRGSRSQP
jgi:uncharacterized membrane protein YcaP (DUF421 family)